VYWPGSRPRRHGARPCGGNDARPGDRAESVRRPVGRDPRTSGTFPPATSDSGGHATSRAQHNKKGLYPMPELPEVETIRRGLATRLTGQTITDIRVRQAQLRHRVDVAALHDEAVGRTITGVDRRGENPLGRLQPDRVLVLHLGMTGRLWVGPPVDHDAPHDHLIFHLGPQLELRFHDTRRFGMCFLTTEAELLHHPRLRHLGPEPLSEAFAGA